jgi:hypothetical protein
VEQYISACHTAIAAARFERATLVVVATTACIDGYCPALSRYRRSTRNLDCATSNALRKPRTSTKADAPSFESTSTDSISSSKCN